MEVLEMKRITKAILTGGMALYSAGMLYLGSALTKPKYYAQGVADSKPYYIIVGTDDWTGKMEALVEPVKGRMTILEEDKEQRKYRQYLFVSEQYKLNMQKLSINK